ncbi:AAA family ATPase [Rhodopirellula bahusiensis]|uniref:AAA family ATPase n=1 Tax=Rhodopirellula bahusiensis TaxID=2014065 RepID=UPI003263FB9F
MLHDANGRRFKLEKATVLYADNGRGKSTLATLLRSVGANDPMPILERKTIDGTLAPKAILQFANGHKVAFDGNDWSEGRPEILVFDADFVEKNVHSGGAVNTAHRKNLLQFALGEKAVALRLAEEEATTHARDAKTALSAAIDVLSGHHEGMRLAEFKKLNSVVDVDKQIAELEKRLVAARSSASLLKRSIPEPVSIPSLEFGPIFEVLGITIEDVQDDAEATVRDHIARISKPGMEAWLSQGQDFDQGGICPYCAQDTLGLELVRAYRTHFNAAYASLKAAVSTLDPKIEDCTSDAIVRDFDRIVENATSSANSWRDQVSVPEIRFERNVALGKLTEIREALLPLVSQKQANPLVAFGTGDEREKIKSLSTELVAPMTATNKLIADAKVVVHQFRENLAAEDIQQIENEIRKLKLSKARHEPNVMTLLYELETAKRTSSDAAAAKTAARSNLNTEMRQTLEKYEASINRLLTKFGASFQIESLGANFRGGAPRSEYGLALRGRSVPLEGGPPSFGTALSEGDKRTLAFAFFVASTLADAKLSTRIVVVDDPMCSLDLNRKQHTRAVLKDICSKAAQLVVFAHDIYFVRDLRNELTPKDGSYSSAVFGLRFASNGYTTFDELDVVKECQSPYFHHHGLLMEFVNQGSGESRQIAKAIRPLLEGYLHRRFPGLIPSDLMFGQVVRFIADAEEPSPVCHAQSLVAELNEINTYAGQFHHDTNPGNADTVQIITSELRTVATQALTVIHKGSL